MVRGLEISEKQKGTIDAFKMEGYGIREMARKTGIPRSTISDYCNSKSLSCQNIAKTKPGRKQILNKKDERAITRAVNNQPINSVKQFYATFPVKLHYETLLKTTNKLGITRVKKFKMHKITPTQKKNRLKWCSKNLKTDWTKYLFSDETYLEVAENGTQYVLMMRGQPIKSWQIQQKDKFPDKILIWGLIHSTGGGRVIVSKGTIRKEGYVQIIKRGVKSFINNNSMSDWVFMQDGASAHTAAISMEKLDKSGIDYCDWPSSSPDLNPIEYIWKLLKDHLGQKGIPKDEAELCGWVEELWDPLCELYCPSLYDSMPRRVTSVIKAKGGHTKY